MKEKPTKKIDSVVLRKKKKAVDKSIRFFDVRKVSEETGDKEKKKVIDIRSCLQNPFSTKKLNSYPRVNFNFSRKTKRIAFGSFFLLLLITAGITVKNSLFVSAATYTFVQTDWSGGTSVDVATHSSNQTGWTKFGSKDSYINNSTSLTLGTFATSSILQTSDDGTGDSPNVSGFDAGTLDKAEVLGTGTDAKIELTLGSAYPDGVTVEESWIREDCTGYSPCYTSLSSWESDRQEDLVTANKIAVAKIDGSWTSADTRVTINGWTTGVNNYIRIYTTASARHDGKWNNTKYRIEYTCTADYQDQIYVYEDYVRIDGLQIKNNADSYSCKGISSNFIDTNNRLYVSNCIITSDLTGAQGIASYDDDRKYMIWNNIIYNIGSRGIKASNSYVYNNVIYNTNHGFEGSNSVLKNNASFNSRSAYDFYDTWNSTGVNNASSDSTATSSDFTDGVENLTATDEFIDPANGDFHLKAGSNLINAGLDLSNDIYLSFVGDVDQAFRTGTWDIGAEEYNGDSEFTGTLTSVSINLGSQNLGLNEISWSSTEPTNTDVKFQLATNDDNSTWNFVGPDGTSGTYYTTAAGETIHSSHNANQYLKYKAYLISTDEYTEPYLEDISFSFPTPTAELISSSYDTEDAYNVLSKIEWSETIPANTDVKFQLRSSADNSSWTSWCGPDDGTGGSCDSSTYFTSPTGTETVDDILTDGSGDRYFQYKAVLVSTDRTSSPTLSDVTLTYVVNDPPEFEAAPTASMDSDGDVNISYSIRDPDTTSGTAQPGYVTPSFEYSLNNGTDWYAISSGLGASDTSNKAVEEVSYTAHTATWQADTQITGQYSTQAKIRVTIDDAEGANNTANSSTIAFTLDTTDPTSTSVAVNASTSPATLTLSASDNSSLQMKLGLESDLSDGSWESYSTSSTIALPTSTSTVYAQYKDAYNNTSSIINTAAPATLENMMIQDTSNVNSSPTEYRLFVAWEEPSEPAEGFASYKIYRSLDQSSWSNIATISDIETNYYGDSTVSGDTLYYYKVTVVDDNGNISDYSEVVNGNANGVQDAGEGGGGTVTPDPLTTISGVSDPPSVLTDVEAVITFNTDESALCTINYGTSSGVYTLSSAETDYNKNHAITLSSLTAETLYYHKITCEDSVSNEVSSSEYSFTTLETQYTADEAVAAEDPLTAITNISASLIVDDSAIISSNTDQNALCTVNYGTTSGSYTLSSAETYYNQDHAITLSSLTAETLYYYQISCTDANSNTVNSTEKSFTTLETQYTATEATAAEDALSTITSISASLITDEEAVISATTNQNALCTVSYGTSTSYGSTQAETYYNQDHGITLSSLSNDTQYYYKISCVDTNSNSKTSSQYAFTTLETQYTATEYTEDVIGETELSVSNVSIGDVTGESVTATWDTNEEASSLVQYATNEDCIESPEDNTCGKVAGSVITSSSTEDYTTDHSVIVDELLPNTKYSYRVLSVDANGEVATSDIETFTTASYSSLSSIKVSELSLTGATITWESSKSISSILEYGLNTDYEKLMENATRDTTHSFVLSGLTTGELYHFRVKGQDEDGKFYASSDHTFTTKAPPSVSDPAIIDIGEKQAVIKFATNIPTEALVIYEDVTTETGTHSGSQGKPDLVKEHNIPLKNLAPGITYNVKLKVKDEDENEAEEDLENFTTLKDETPPEISQVKTDSALTQDGNVQTIISWRTNELTTSSLKIKSPSDKEKVINASENLTNNHVVVLTSLKTGTVYDYQIKTKDGADNETDSQNYAILTPQKQENIIQVIIENFQDIFGWTNVVGQ